MAEGGPQRNEVDELKDEFKEEYLTCQICQDVFDDPATLQCGHTFCRQCLTDFTKTRPEAISNEIIPCALRCEGTKVPRPSEPMEEWSKQIKPQFIINGLMEKFNSMKERERELPVTTKPIKQKHARCTAHGEDLKLVCNGCKRVICKKCRRLYHRRCTSIVLMEAQFEAMQTYLVDYEPKIHRTIERTGVSIATMKSGVDQIINSKRSVKSRIEKNIRKREAELLQELETISQSQILDLQERIKLEEMNMQKYQQKLQLIDQTVKSESLIDTCDMYLTLLSDDGEDMDKVKGRPARDSVPNVTFSHDADSLMESLRLLDFGELNITYEQVDVDNVSVSQYVEGSRKIDTKIRTNASASDRVVSSRKIDLRVLPRVDSDRKEPSLYDITVLVVDGEETLVVTDWNNYCVKSFYARNKRTGYSKLPMDSQPCRLAQYEDNQVLVVLPWSQQIVRMSVRPQLVKISVIDTCKMYYSLAVLSSSSLAAGARSPPCIDILDMEGRVMKSIQRCNKKSLFTYPYYICVHPDGHLLVSDNGRKCVLCVTLQGKVVWKYTPTEDRALGHPQGITTTRTGDVLLVDMESNKIIQLSRSGQFISDVLTSQDGIDTPMGLCLNNHDSLFVCEYTGQLKQYEC